MMNVQGVSRRPVSHAVIVHSGVRTVLSVSLAPLEVTEYAVQLVRIFLYNHVRPIISCTCMCIYFHVYTLIHAEVYKRPFDYENVCKHRL